MLEGTEDGLESSVFESERYGKPLGFELMKDII